MTPYETIWDAFASKVNDYMDISDEDLDDLLLGYLKSSIARFRKCTSDLSDRDDDLERFNVDLTDIEIDILALQMVEEWLRPQVNSALLTKQIIGGAEEKFYAQSNHLDKLLALKEQNKIDAQKAYRDYQTEQFRNNI